MAQTSEAKRAAARQYQAEQRAYYRGQRVKRAGKWYNPLLDSSDHPGNIRGWIHGTIEGYTDAGCACERCAPVGREENQRKSQVRIDKRLDEHRSTVNAICAAHVPDLSHDAAGDLAEAIIATHRVRNQFRATLTYDRIPVELAVANWMLATERDLPADVADTLVDQLLKELGS